MARKRGGRLRIGSKGVDPGERGSAGKGDASASTCGVRGSCIGEEARRLTGTE